MSAPGVSILIIVVGRVTSHIIVFHHVQQIHLIMITVNVCLQFWKLSHMSAFEGGGRFKYIHNTVLLASLLVTCLSAADQPREAGPWDEFDFDTVKFISVIFFSAAFPNLDHLVQTTLPILPAVFAQAEGPSNFPAKGNFWLCSTAILVWYSFAHAWSCTGRVIFSTLILLTPDFSFPSLIFMSEPHIKF